MSFKCIVYFWTAPKIHLLLPSWAAIFCLTSLLLLLFGWVSNSFLTGVSVTSLFLVWRWLTDLAQSLERIRPGKRIQPLTIPFEFQKCIDELSNSLERYATVTENLAGAVLIRNTEGKITYCNPYSEILLGISNSELLQSQTDRIEEITNERDRPAYRKAHMLSLIGEPFQYRHQYRHTSGVEMWAETRVTPLLNQQGEVTATLSIMMDITHQVKVQEQLERLNSDLTDFNYMISHDLRTPLVTLRGGISLIAPAIATHGTSAQKDMFQHIENAQARLHTLVEAVVEYGKINTSVFEKTPVDTLPLIQQVIELYRPKITALSGSITIPSDLPIIIASPIPVTQIFGNLIENALKYCHPERAPVIELSATREKMSPEITIALKDNGIGIKPEHVSRIFRPFQRVNTSAANGSGIGLACVKKLVDKMDGAISLESTPGEGTTFFLKFPLALP
jgi:PAS domain S-box-containing protein